MEEIKSTRARPGQFLTFNLRQRPYGVPIETVREINSMVDITPVPGMPKYVSGVINLRGKVIPVVNLSVRFGVENAGVTRETCIIVIEVQGSLVGMIVDSVSEVIMLPSESIEPAPLLSECEEGQWITGMGKIDSKIVLLLDIVGTLSQVKALAPSVSLGA